MKLSRRLSAGVLGAGLAALGIVPTWTAAAATAATAAAPTSDPSTAARDGAAWIAGQLATDGWLPSPTDPTKPDLNTTAFGVIALASTGTGGTAAARALDFVKSRLSEYVTVGGADAPGPLATLVLAATASGRDPRTFFGTDVVARLQATRQASGLFGAADPKFDGAYRQGLALAALAAADVDDPAGVAWLDGQQCDDGGWVAFRASTSTPCPASDPANFTGEDSNSTAMAVMGLVAQGATPVRDAAAWFDATQGTDGGWAYVAAPDQGSDANSTGLAVMALKALGVDARSSRFTTSASGDPIALLLSFQLGCSAGGDAGAFAYQPVRGDLTANGLATVQAVPAVAGATLPVPSTGSALPAAAATAACAAPATSGTPASPPAAAPSATTATGSAANGQPLANTGVGDGLVALALVGALLLLAGALVLRTCDGASAHPRSNSA